MVSSAILHGEQIVVKVEEPLRYDTFFFFWLRLAGGGDPIFYGAHIAGTPSKNKKLDLVCVHRRCVHHLLRLVLFFVFLFFGVTFFT